jgi:asparagine synthase (glutamine-hydrolysing)
MPGIAVLVGVESQTERDDLMAKMIGAMRHEEAYVSETMTATGAASVALGYAGHGDTSLWEKPAAQVGPEPAMVLFSGELYREIKRDQSDAEYVAERYAKEGVECLGSLDGTFSCVILDRHNQCLYIFNDRFGMHRLFCGQEGNQVCIASEAKAIAAAFPACRSLDPTGVAEFLACGCTIRDQSLLHGVLILPAASLLTVRPNGELRRQTYFSPLEWESQSRYDIDDFEDAMFAALHDAIRRRRGAVAGKVSALSLTGGVDSRLVLAVGGFRPGEIPCYSFGSYRRESLDVKIARQVAQRSGQEFLPIVIDRSFAADLPEYYERAVHLSDGYIGIGGAAELRVVTRAREISPIRLTGNYGSELLRGVRAFGFRAPRPKVTTREIDPVLEEVRSAFDEIGAMASATSFVAFHQAQHQAYGRTAVERAYLRPRTPFLDRDLVRLMYRAPTGLDGLALSRELIRRSSADLLSVATDRGYFGRAPKPLRATTRVWREVMFKAEYAIGNGLPDTLAPLSPLFGTLGLESFVLGRNKFYHVRQYLRHGLADFLRDHLLDPALVSSIPFIDSKGVHAALCDHYEHRENNAGLLDRLLTLCVYARQISQRPYND